MKREEIRERAAEIAHYFVVYPKPRDHQKAERILGEVVRATLEEAARAVCYRCNCGNQPAHSEMFGWFHPDGGANPDCYAGSIHDLIAAMDKEASHG